MHHADLYRVDIHPKGRYGPGFMTHQLRDDHELFAWAALEHQMLLQGIMPFLTLLGWYHAFMRHALAHHDA